MNGTDSKEEYVTPFQIHHIFWDCLLDGPRVSAPEKVRALIDSGSHTVIIDYRLAERLALRQRKLPEPLEVSLAMGGKDEQLMLNEWVKLAPSAIGLQWKSRTVRAIIAKNLVCSVILGQPFLKANQIVVDHDTLSCMSKIDSFNLLKKPTWSREDEQRERLKRGTITKRSREDPFIFRM